MGQRTTHAYDLAGRRIKTTGALSDFKLWLSTTLFSGKLGKSQFRVSQEELRYILQSQLAVGSPVKAMGDGRFGRLVKTNKLIGYNSKTGGKLTQYMSVITNGTGNILTATPGRVSGL